MSDEPLFIYQRKVAKLVLDLRDDVAVHGSRDSAVQLVTARDLAS